MQVPVTPEFSPLLQLGQPVRHPDHADIGVVVGIIYTDPERALVRWTESVTFEAIESLTEVQQSATLAELMRLGWRSSKPTAAAATPDQKAS
jgi:hypothetical protein